MATQLVPGVDDQGATMACIGHVCVQWALLENNLLGILSACQGVPMLEAAILFGGLDMKPRLGVAINLAEYHRWKPPLLKRLRDLRTEIDRLKLIDKRNMLIHGVHRASPKPQTFELYSPRKRGSAQIEEWTVMKALETGNQIRAVALEAHAIFTAYGKWKFPNHSHEDLSGQFVAAPIGLIARAKQYLSPRPKG